MTDRTPVWRSGLASRNRRAIGSLFAAVLALTVVADAQTLPSTQAPAAIEVRAEAVAAFDVRDPGRRQFGLLEFRGGLALRSSYKNFGGMSAIRVASDGALGLR